MKKSFVFLLAAFGLMGFFAYNTQYPLHTAAYVGKSQHKDGDILDKLITLRSETGISPWH